jgi:hypothetical protein
MGLTAKTTYRYSILAYDAAGNISSKTSIVYVTTPPLPSTKFVIGDTVQTTASLYVRATPSTSGTSLGIQAKGQTGKVIGGPIYANSYWWWTIDYATGPDGWSVETYLIKITDTTPPIRSSGSPSGSLPSGTTQATMSLSTNENATCKYSTAPNTTYASMTNTFANTGATSHSVLLTSLTDNISYSYYIRCQDIVGNANTDDFIINFIIQDTVPPSVPSNLSATTVSFSQIDLNWTGSADTGGSGLKGYNVYRNNTKITSTPVSTTYFSDTGLSPNANYAYNITAVDNAGNESAKSAGAGATTLPSTTALSLSTLTGTRGQNVVMPLILTNGGTPQISAVTLEISYDATKLSATQVQIGNAANGAAKTVSSSNPSAGLLRLVIYGLNQNSISNGQITLITFHILSGAATGFTPLNILNLTASNKDGTAVTVTAQNGSITVQ